MGCCGNRLYVWKQKIMFEFKVKNNLLYKREEQLGVEVVGVDMLDSSQIVRQVLFGKKEYGGGDREIIENCYQYLYSFLVVNFFYMEEIQRILFVRFNLLGG